MSCRRAYEIDLLELLARPRAPEFDDFRAHYPTCPECAAEVRAWTELDATLRGDDAHPEPELLLRLETRLESGADALSAGERALLAAHLERCVSCRDELRALRALDDPPGEPAPARLRAALARALSGLRWLVWQPGFAYALVVILSVPVLVSRWPLDRAPAPAIDSLARPAPAESSGYEPRGPVDKREEAATALGDRPLRPTPSRQRTGPAPGEAVPEAPSPPAELPEREPHGPLDLQLPAPAPVLERRVVAPSARSVQPERSLQRAEHGVDPGRRAASAPSEVTALEEARAPTGDPVAPSGLLSLSDPLPVGDLAGDSDVEQSALPQGTYAPTAGAGAGFAPSASGAALAGALRIVEATRVGDTLRAELPMAGLVPATGGTFEVRVLHPDGRRELRELLELEGPRDVPTLDLPTAWATVGAYRVEIRASPTGLGYAQGDPLRRLLLTVPPAPR